MGTKLTSVSIIGIFGLLLVAGSSVAIFSSLDSQEALATSPGTNGQVAFKCITLPATGDNNICLINSDGTSFTQLTTSGLLIHHQL